PGQHGQHEEPVAQELPAQQVELRDRLRRQPLQRAGAPLLRDRAHRDRGHEHHEQPGEQPEQPPQRGHVRAVERPEPEEQRQRQERDHQDVRRRMIEVAAVLAARQRPRLLHRATSSSRASRTEPFPLERDVAAAPSSRAPSASASEPPVSSLNNCSRLARSRCSSQSVQPRSAASRKIVGRSSSPPLTVSFTRARPSTRSARRPATPRSAASAAPTPSPPAATTYRAPDLRCSESSATPPSATSRPRLTISSRLHVASTSPSTCVLRITVRSRPSSVISRRISTRWFGS